MAPVSFSAFSVCAVLLSAVLVNAQFHPESTTQRMLSRHRERFHVIFEWKTFNYTWPSGDSHQRAVSNGDYIPENVILSGMKYYNNKLYVTLPRMKAGVPATLAWIPSMPEPPSDTGPLLNPFPSWEKNKIGDCNSFQSVQSVEIDTKGIMWIIDNGRSATMNPPDSSPVCSPSLSTIDLNDPSYPITRYFFPPSVVNASSYLNDIVVDDTDQGYVYITDNSRADPGIVVFSSGTRQSWKYRDNNSMMAAQNAIRFVVGEVNTTMTVNIDGIALGPRYVNDKNVVDRNVYFCPMSSFRLYGTTTSVLRNQTLSERSADFRMRLVVNLGEKASQTDGMIADEEGYLFFGLVANYTIAQWDRKNSFTTGQEIIAQDPNFLQWIGRFAFDNNGGMYVVINKLHNFVANKVNATSINYRILRTQIGTKSYLYSPMLMPVPKSSLPATRSSAPSSSLAITAAIFTISALFVR